MQARAPIAFLLACALQAQSAAPAASLDAARQAYQTGDLKYAGQILAGLLKSQPNDAGALILMGVVLDSANRYPDAEPYYQRALQVAPGSPQVLNNAANHYLATGDRSRARDLYRKALSGDPQQVNASLQLAQMSIDDRQGREALAYLGKAEAAGAEPGVALLRARALALTGQCDAARDLLKGLLKSGGDAPVYYSAGMAQAECKQFDDAEGSFSQALDADPRNFDILYNLGLAALRAGHTDRAENVLAVALRERPEDIDSLYAMAQVFEQRQQLVRSAALLTQAEKIAPNRADAILLLAHVSARLEFFEDSAAAYDRYLKLKPDDDVARRERGFELARANQFHEAVRDLEWYTARHPRDAAGYFELAIARVPENREAALSLLDRAITLDPAFYQARYTRARIHIEDDHAPEAIPDLEQFLEKEPKNVEALARLGQAYLAVDRAGDAARVLERALEVAPESTQALVLYHGALVRLKRRTDAAAVLTRVRDSANREGPWRHVGLVDYLSLSAEDRRARRLSNLQQNSAANPGNLWLRITLARELLAQGKKDEGIRIIQEMSSSGLSAAQNAECGRILLDLEKFAEARIFLERALALSPALGQARVDLAIVLFRMHDSAGALRELDGDPDQAHQGDSLLVRAQILDAEGKTQEAAAALNQGIHAAPTRAGLYYQATSFLLKHRRYREAQTLLAEASRILPDDRELLLAQVVTLDLLREDADWEKLLAQIQTRWPEWERPYLVKGILLETKLSSGEARQALETAIALGANTPEAYYYEALAIFHAAPDELDAAQHAVDKALGLTTSDPYIHLLAGRIWLEREQYAKAAEQLEGAVRLQPGLLSAHNALREAYSALGDQAKSREEVETIKRLAAEKAQDETIPAVEDVLFAVRPPQ